jgi:uncharacterized FlaG/YvyC family protein
MEIEPISFSSSTSAKDRWLDLWAQKLQAKPKSGAASAETADADVPSADGVDVEHTEHEGTGAQIVRLVDSDTGRVISQIPHQQVLDLVASLIQQNEVERGSSDGQH